MVEFLCKAKKFIGINQEYLSIRICKDKYQHEFHDCIYTKERYRHFIILWNKGESSLQIFIDDIPYILQTDQLLFLTDLHHYKSASCTNLRVIQFNRAFHCILGEHVSIGCRGILWLVAAKIPIISIPPESIEVFNTFWNILEYELEQKDVLQIDMLRLLVRRFLILATRLYLAKHKNPIPELIEPIQNFLVLVETHFKKYHTVQEYAKLMHFTPKNLAKIVSKYQDKTPHQIIQERILLEAKRMLFYSEKPIKDISYELGFMDLASFDRFFKRHIGLSPKKAREKGEIANN